METQIRIDHFKCSLAELLLICDTHKIQPELNSFGNVCEWVQREINQDLKEIWFIDYKYKRKWLDHWAYLKEDKEEV